MKRQNYHPLKYVKKKSIFFNQIKMFHNVDLFT